MSDPVEMPDGTLTQRERLSSVLSYGVVGPLEVNGGAYVPVRPDFPAATALNRIVGVEAGWPLSEEELETALEAVPEGTGFYVATEGPESDRAGTWLADRGFEPALGWMGFRQRPRPSPLPPTDLRISEATTADDFDAFAHITSSAFHLDESRNSRLSEAGRHGWKVWVARDGDEPVASAGMFTRDGVGYLGIDGTLERARGRGAQGALLATRISAAFDAGLDGLFIETGERREGEPDQSYRNILRAGFREVAVTRHWSASGTA